MNSSSFADVFGIKKRGFQESSFLFIFKATQESAESHHHQASVDVLRLDCPWRHVFKNREKKSEERQRERKNERGTSSRGGKETRRRGLTGEFRSERRSEGRGEKHKEAKGK